MPRARRRLRNPALGDAAARFPRTILPRRCRCAAGRTVVSSRRARPTAQAARARCRVAERAGNRSRQSRLVDAAAGLDASTPAAWLVAAADRQRADIDRDAASGVFVELPADTATARTALAGLSAGNRIARHAAPVGDRVSQRPRAALGHQHRRAGCARDDLSRSAGTRASTSRDSARPSALEKQTHRLVFWPRTNSPLVLVTNQHPTAAARFGHLRVMKRSASTIATEPWSATPPTGRLVAAYLRGRVRSELLTPRSPARTRPSPCQRTIGKRSTTAACIWPSI